MGLIRWYIHAGCGLRSVQIRFSDGFEGAGERDDTAGAIVDRVRDEPRDSGGILVRFESKDAVAIADIAHESPHMAMDMSAYTGAKVDSSSQETFPYPVVRVAGCINRVRTGKFKD